MLNNLLWSITSICGILSVYCQKEEENDGAYEAMMLSPIFLAIGHIEQRSTVLDSVS